MSAIDDTLFWRNKYIESEMSLEKLKDLAHKALEDFEALQHRYKQGQVQYDELMQRHIETAAKLESLEKVLEPACEEYSRLQDMYKQAETNYQVAVDVASKCYKQNVNLKRQSRMLLDKIESTEQLGDLLAIMEDEPTGSFSLENEKIADQLQKISDLEAKLVESESFRLEAMESENKLRCECDHLRKELENAERTVDDYKLAFDKLQQASMLTCTEYEELKQKYEMQMELNREAENFAHTMLAERDAVVRESSILLTSAASEKRLANLLMEVEQLTVKLELERKEHAVKVKQLESLITESEGSRQLDVLEEKLSLLSGELEACLQANKELEKWKAKLETENQMLTDQLDVARQKLLPPPPPPPPAVPPPPLLIRPMQALIIKKKNKGGKGDVTDSTKSSKAKDQTYEQAMQEMMERIKRGQGLKPVSQTTKCANANQPPSSPPAIMELQNTMRNLKKSGRPTIPH